MAEYLARNLFLWKHVLDPLIKVTESLRARQFAVSTEILLIKHKYTVYPGEWLKINNLGEIEYFLFLKENALEDRARADNSALEWEKCQLKMAVRELKLIKAVPIFGVPDST